MFPDTILGAIDVWSKNWEPTPRLPSAYAQALPFPQRAAPYFRHPQHAAPQGLAQLLAPQQSKLPPVFFSPAANQLFRRWTPHSPHPNASVREPQDERLNVAARPSAGVWPLAAKRTHRRPALPQHRGETLNKCPPPSPFFCPQSALCHGHYRPNVSISIPSKRPSVSASLPSEAFEASRGAVSCRRPRPLFAVQDVTHACERRRQRKPTRNTPRPTAPDKQQTPLMCRERAGSSHGPSSFAFAG